MNHKINMTETYTTRDGRPARVLCLDAKGLWPVVALVEDVAARFTLDGQNKYETNYDLIPAPKAHKVVLWVNVFADGLHEAHRNKQAADYWSRKRIACIRMEATAQEGQYDE